MSKWIVSAFADEYSASLEGQIKALTENGLKFIELRFIDGKNIADMNTTEVKTLKNRLDRAGIMVSAIGSPLGKINLADDFEAHLEKTKRVCETANLLETDKVRMFSFYLHKDKSREECREEVLDKLGRMLDVADGFGVKLCHENEAKIYGETPEYCIDVLKHFGGRLRAVFDMGNFVLDGCDPLAGYGLLKDYIEYFHIKDAMAAGAIVPAGCGEARIGEILHLYREDSKKDVLLSIEPHLQTFDGLNALVGKSFDNPYKFETKEIAFTEAVKRTKELL
ncbi:MAG: sugar phosphate isomerase/epimerase [Clostridia bacterium]|nr:sugar phosphate isomerase/epimerase [Clostridia bacterium]